MNIILTNAKIFTADKKCPWADTIAFDDRYITYVGKKAEWIGRNTGRAKVYDMKGKMIIPGIVDSHVHPAAIAKCSWHVRLPLSYDLDEILRYIKEYAERHPKEEKPFLFFEYYPSVIFDERGPRKELLDSVVSDRPCLVQDFGEHMAWVNTKMLEALEVTAETPDPSENIAVYVRDENGEPTGFVKEMAWTVHAENMYRNIGWRPPVEMTPELMKPVLDFFINHGVTAIADGFIEGESVLETLAEMERNGELQIRYDGFVRCDSLSELPEKVEEVKRYDRKYGGRHIRVNTMKVFMDGTNESGNAFLVEPKVNDPAGRDRGRPVMSEDEFTKYLIFCNDHHIDVHVHLVGDGAFRLCCNAYEKAKKTSVKKWNIELTLAHCELVHPDDMERPARLGIRINWTPRWAGGCYGEQGKLYLGESRWNSMYQFNPMIESGADVAFSSDVVTWSKLERANPFYGIQIGHTRVDIEDPLDPQSFPGSMRPMEDAKLSREVLLTGSTIKGAEQMHLDDITGSLEVGKLADMVVLSEDFFNIEADKIKDIKVEAVFFEGKLIRGSL